MPSAHLTSRSLLIAGALLLAATTACSDSSDNGDEGATTAAPDETSVGAPDPATGEPTEAGDAPPGDSTTTPPLACPEIAVVEEITGVDIIDLSGPAAGDPTELSCQYIGDAEEFTTGTAVRISLDPYDGGPSDFGTPVDGLGAWAEVSGADGVIYVGFGDSMLEIDTYADLTDDQLIALVEATLEAGATD